MSVCSSFGDVHAVLFWIDFAPAQVRNTIKYLVLITRG